MTEERIPQPFSIEYLIEKAIPYIYGNIIQGRISEDSTFGNKMNKQIPDNSITKALEQKLNPAYMNSVFTWAQIERALNETYYELPLDKNNP